MKDARGSRSWREEQLAAERARLREGQRPTPPRHDVLPPQVARWVTLLWPYRYPIVTAALILALLIIVFHPSRSARRTITPHTRPLAAPTALTFTRTPWTSAAARPFSSGLWATVTNVGVGLRSGPAALWPAVSTPVSLTVGQTLVALGVVRNSQESRLWVAVRLPTAEVGWLPSSATTLTGTLRAPPTGRPDSYVVTGQASLPYYRRPLLPDRSDGHTPAQKAAGVVGPGSVLPLRGVLSRYFDGKVGTMWVCVRLPDGSFGWLYAQDAALRRDLRYLAPPPRADQAPWVAPLPAGQTLLGAYGEQLGTTQWPLRGGTDVRGQADDRIQAAADGVVIFTGYSVRWDAYYVVVRHNGVWEGWQTAYIGLTGQGSHGLAVRQGQVVRRGQLLGFLAPGRYQQPTRLRFVVQTPDGSPIESQNVLGWP